MNVKTILFACLLCLLIGLFSGAAIYKSFLCPNTDKAIVKQIKDDGKKLIQVKKEVQIKYVYREKIKTIIKTTPADECFDKPVPADAADLLRQSFNTERP